MAVTTYICRLFGGRNVTTIHDSVAGTVTVAGQVLTLSTLSAALQAQFAAAIASGSGSNPIFYKGSAAFGGCNVSQAIGSIADANPAWANAIRAALANVRDDAATIQAGL
ncbi:hypothetical protein AAFX91_00245 [Bradyrhizobium sp. 31Argb]|uniref:hypothetical protein n=1 Tax=Bradyrhizobium sp. 31Argb TaxID=3141247 RepID=UPI003749C514